MDIGRQAACHVTTLHYPKKDPQYDTPPASEKGALTDSDDDVSGVEDDAMGEALAQVTRPRQEDHHRLLHAQALQVASQGLPPHPLLAGVGGHSVGRVAVQGANRVPMVGHLRGWSK